MAQASHIAASVQAMTSAAAPSYALGYVTYVLQSFASNHPQIDLTQILTDQAMIHLPQTRNECITRTVSEGYWAKAIPKDQFIPRADLSAVLKVAAANEPANLQINVPTLIVQGTADDTVLPAWTDAVVRSLCKNGSPVFYTTYPGVGHETVVTEAAAQVRSWIDARFSGTPPQSNCPTGL